MASASQFPAAGSRLSPAQEAKLRDTLVRGRWYMQRGQYGPALEEFQAALAMDPANREAQAAIRQAREPSENPQRQSDKPSVASPLPAAGSRLYPAQEAKLRDTLVRGRWYMQHQQYGAALEEFQAVLAMDPSNREAQAAIQQAREAHANR